MAFPAPPAMTKPSILFVCLGNICRSPLAEAALRAEAQRSGLDVVVDSAGTGGWHAGEPPDHRAQAVARKHGVDISGLRARKVSREDFRRFTHILALDTENLRDLERLRPADSTAELSLLLDHVAGREGEAVADPWYGGPADFEVTWSDVTAAAKALVRELAEPQ
jgi:protein-tyrosine phosphatase